MYRKQVAKKPSPSHRSTPISKDITPRPIYGSLSSVVQRAQQDPNSVSGGERQQLESAIGTRATSKILTGEQTSWMPEFKGISDRLWGNSGQQVAPIQAKLTIGEVGDKYEQQADRVAKEVVQRIKAPQTNQMSSDTLQRRETETKEELQLKLESSGIQRKQLPVMVQRREAIGGGEASTDLESGINRSRGGGQPLDKGLQKSMGQAMGADFSGVKVHTDTTADKLSQSIQAKAFTTGQDVFFKQGSYNPNSKDGQELIAHELTHVVQQSESGEVRKKIQRFFKSDGSQDLAEEETPLVSSSSQQHIIEVVDSDDEDEYEERQLTQEEQQALVAQGRTLHEKLTEFLRMRSNYKKYAKYLVEVKQWRKAQKWWGYANKVLSAIAKALALTGVGAIAAGILQAVVSVSKAIRKIASLTHEIIFLTSEGLAQDQLRPLIQGDMTQEIVSEAQRTTLGILKSIYKAAKNIADIVPA